MLHCFPLVSINFIIEMMSSIFAANLAQPSPVLILEPAMLEALQTQIYHSQGLVEAICLINHVLMKGKFLNWI